MRVRVATLISLLLVKLKKRHVNLIHIFDEIISQCKYNKCINVINEI